MIVTFQCLQSAQNTQSRLKNEQPCPALTVSVHLHKGWETTYSFILLCLTANTDMCETLQLCNQGLLWLSHWKLKVLVIMMRSSKIKHNCKENSLSLWFVLQKKSEFKWRLASCSPKIWEENWPSGLQILPGSDTEFWPWWANLQAISRSIPLLFSNPYVVFLYTGTTMISCTTQNAAALNRSDLLAGAWCLSAEEIYFIYKDFGKFFFICWLKSCCGFFLSTLQIFLWQMRWFS